MNTIEPTLDLSHLTKEEMIVFIKKLAIGERILEFTNEAHVDAKGEKLNFKSFRHMEELFKHGHLYKDVVITGGAQIGKSIWLIISALAMAAEGLNVFFVLPKLDMRDSYVQEKVQRPISISEEYKKYVKDSVSNKVGQIQFGKGIIKFVGSNSDIDFTSFAADALIYEETDKCVKPENLDLGMSRIADSAYKIRIFISNPTNEKGFITLWYEKSDKRVRVCPCDKCGKFSELDWFKSVVKKVKDSEGNVVNHVLRDKTWETGSPDDIKIKCPIDGCDGNLIRDSVDVDWKSTAVSEQGIVGFHMPSLISPKVSVRELWYEFKDGLNSPKKMENFYSMRLAIPYAESGNKVSVSVLEKCVEEGYKFELHPDCAYSEYASKEPTSMGVDTSPSHFDITITKKCGSRERLIYIGKHDPREGLYFLDELIERYNIECAVIDKSPEYLAALNFQETAACQVWRCHYAGEGDDRDLKYKEAEGMINIDQTECLDRSYVQFKLGKVILPENYADILDGSFLDEMQALSRVTVDTKTGFKYKWQGSDNNHARHSFGYCNLARETMRDTEISAENSIYIG